MIWTLYIPFICIAIGALINWKGLPEKLLDVINFIMNAALMLLMCVVGLNVGTSREVLDNIGKIGLNCIIMCLGSVFLLSSSWLLWKRQYFRLKRSG